MNRSNGTLIVVGLASLVVGGAISFFLLKPANTCVSTNANDKGNYLLFFGDCEINPSPNGRVTVTDPTAFENALANMRPRLNTLTIVPTVGSPPRPIGPGAISGGNPPTSYVSVTQRGQSGAPCTLHVTQKIGLDNPTDVQKLLALLDPQTQ
jgi:hypothetical protein